MTMTNAQVALQASANIHAAYGRPNGLGWEGVQKMANEYLLWLDAADARAAKQREIETKGTLEERVTRLEEENKNV